VAGSGASDVDVLLGAEEKFAAAGEVVAALRAVEREMEAAGAGGAAGGEPGDHGGGRRGVSGRGGGGSVRAGRGHGGARAGAQGVQRARATGSGAVAAGNDGLHGCSRQPAFAALTELANRAQGSSR
jgi:hypothetical protein